MMVKERLNVILAVFFLAMVLLLVGCTSTNNNPDMFPDPYVSNQGYSQITFINLPAVCTIEVYAVSGELVTSLTEANGDGEAVWDVTNDKGEALVTGLYSYVIIGPDSKQRGKIVITK